jgi:hypothetical protein
MSPATLRASSPALPRSPVTQTSFQRTLWRAATAAHAAGDRADARIMLRMIESIDEGDYTTLHQLGQALRGHYRDSLGKVPQARSDDGYHEASS